MPAPKIEHDRGGRPLENLRISVTDRCNLRCGYCMPGKDYSWLPRQDILSFEEVDRLVEAFVRAGISKIRLTGGEPLLRRDLHQLVRMLADRPEICDLAMTTNAVLLADHASALREAGLGRLTISLDTLNRDVFRGLTRRDDLERVLHGIEAARRVGFRGTKLNTVVMRGVNEEELVPLVEFAREHELELRFIEYMDVAGATRWVDTAVVPREEILERLEASFGPLHPEPAQGAAPAERFRLGDGTIIGLIASTTTPFCRACNRSRLTADGMWFLCLYAERGLSLRDALRAGASAAEIETMLRLRWSSREDRGAELRLVEAERTRSRNRAELHADPHLEMHTRGG